MRPMLLVCLVVGISCHVGLFVGLLRLRSHRLKAWLALPFPPLAPYWGMKFAMRRRSLGWILAVLCLSLLQFGKALWAP